MPFTGLPLTWLIFWLICYGRRMEEIGGWLLFYYIQLYMSIVLTLLLLPLTFENFEPSQWGGAWGQYALFLVASVPPIVVMIIQVMVSHRLRRTRDAAYLVPLRRVLWANMLFSVVKFVIDIKLSPINTILDAFGVIWAAFWLPYFYRSIRVGHVFVTKDWARVAAMVVD